MWMKVLVVIVIIGSPILGICLWFYAGRGEHGERWTKRRFQGPLVPLSSEEIAEDEARSKALVTIHDHRKIREVAR